MSRYRKIAIGVVAAFAVALGTTAALAIPTSPAAPVAHDALPAPVEAPRQIPTAGSAPVVPPAHSAARVTLAKPKPAAHPVTAPVAVAPVSVVVTPKPAPARPAVKPHAAVILAPVWQPASCANPDADGYVDIPTSSGVQYDLDTIPSGAGHYLIGAGQHTVTAFTNSAGKSWSFTVADLSVQCGIPALDTTPNAGDVPPVWHQATCLAPQATVDLPNVAGVTYSLDTIPSYAGNGYQIDAGVHTVTADTAGSSHSPTWTFTVVAPSC